MNLHELHPIALLEFLEKINEDNIQVSVLDVAVELNSNWAEITVILNEYQFSYLLPLDSTHSVGAAHYYHESPEALDTLKISSISSLSNWIEKEYITWVKNDTGHNMSDAFKNELFKEIERIIDEI